MEKTKKQNIFEKPIFRTKIKSANVKLFPEAGLGYLLGPILALISNGVVNVWLVQYWDKVLLLGDWNPLFQTLLPIISAIFVVIGNLLVGHLMERKPSIAGKARPLILLGMPLIAIALLVLFLVPLPTGAGGSSSNLLASILIAVGYNLYYALAWPIYYTSHSALVNLSTRDGSKRNLLSTCIMAAQLGAAGLAGMAGGFLVDFIGLLPVYQYGIKADGTPLTTNILEEANSLANGFEVKTLISPDQANSKWTILMIIMIVCLVIGCLLEFYFTRERITEENVKNAAVKEDQDIVKAEKTSMREQIKICAHDKYWWLIIIFFFLYQFGGQMKNNDLSFYSQAMTGENKLSSTINTVGAIPTALGMLIVWPIAHKLTKSKTISLGSLLAVLGGAIAFVALIPSVASNDGAVWGLSIASFVVKALGTAPAMYISLALLANVLDHQEAVYGKRTDGFTMAVYGSIMVCMSGICNGIIAGINTAAKTSGMDLKLVNTILGYGVESACYLLMGIMFLFMNVEKFTKEDQIKILEDQKAACLARGEEWIDPQTRMEMEEKETARQIEEARISELKEKCAKKGWNFEEKEAEYQAQKAKAEEKKAAKKKGK
ncbi:MAG: MFS transporter [Mollicutes bacterium]|nr:MFS transporter [Mollicutes bacterium]